MKLDRQLQRALLELAAEKYPDTLYPHEWTSLGGDALPANALYLEEHGLLNVHTSRTMSSHGPDILSIAATARGMDFLTDDGGLGAVLGVVTVRLHADTIRDLIEAKLAASDLPPEQKNGLISALKKLPEEGLKAVTKRLVEIGLDHLPEALPYLMQASEALGKM